MPTSTLPALEVISLVQNLATLNLAYLAICVTIILFAGGLFYVFNFKPLQESIRAQEENLKQLQSELDLKILSIDSEFKELVSGQSQDMKASLSNSVLEIESFKRTALEKIESSESKITEYISETKKSLNDLWQDNQRAKLRHLWSDHYMWDGREVYENALDSLLEYKEAARKYKLNFASNDLWLIRVENMLNQIGSYSLDDENRQLTHDRLQSLLGSISDKEQELRIKTKVKEVFSDRNA